MRFQEGSVRHISLIFIAVSILTITVFQNEVFAQELGMSITASASEGSSTITVTGQTASKIKDVTLVVNAPNGNVVSIAQISPDTRGNFEKEFKVGGQLWSQNGVYRISAQQGSSSIYNLSLNVNIVDGTATKTMVTQSTLEGSGLVTSNITKEFRGLSITADAMEGSTNIGIQGTTDKTFSDVTLTVKSPNGNVVFLGQVSPDIMGNFAADITTGGPLWKQDGFYTVTAQQDGSSNYKDSVQVEIIDGVVIPEFGAIAALILAVAIISIIVVSAKSRLSIMPKY